MQTPLSFKNLLSVSQLTHTDISHLIDQALQLKSNHKNKQTHFTKPTILASLFFEPSTRTRFSFEAAMLNLGGQYINLEQANTSSLSKGETLEDMGRVMSSYADIAVIRHPDVTSLEKFSKHTTIPIINGGNGGQEHPTQSLVDLMTIFENHNRLTNLNIGFWGDLNYARTVNSLSFILSTFSNNTFHFIAPKPLQINPDIQDSLTNNQATYHQTDNLHETIPKLDVLYITRTQTERIKNNDQIQLTPITARTLENMQSHCIILHPLPRVSEISTDVDRLKQAKYFIQSENGLYMRMALLKALLT